MCWNYSAAMVRNSSAWQMDAQSKPLVQPASRSKKSFTDSIYLAGGDFTLPEEAERRSFFRFAFLFFLSNTSTHTIRIFYYLDIWWRVSS
mmetsp:Transcript_21589/g.34696  ORF Transcript_21589/g.34696 Transcript_21589/m.34696 type:complete len:90 (-) Transcript_21589:80-349(-)